MHEGFATKEGTFRYLKRFPGYSRDFYGYDGERFVASLGIGTFKPEPYRENNYIVNFKEAVKEAVHCGINLIDTAINYRYQVSEREVGEALAELFAAGTCSRDELVVTTKAGFVPLDFPFPENPYEWIEATVLQPGLARKEEVVVDQHCMSPGFLRWSLEQSLENLGLQSVDILFLHNPETQLGYVPYDTVMGRIREAFACFETLADEGKIRAYGVASWNALLYEEGHAEYISLGDLVAIARSVGGEKHRFRYLELPLNLAKPHALRYVNQKGGDGRYYTLSQAAAGWGLRVIASASLLQMNLFKKPFNSRIGTLTGTESLTDLHTALQFARSFGVLSALFGSTHPEFVRSNAALAHLPRAPHGNLMSLLSEGENRVV